MSWQKTLVRNESCLYMYTINKLRTSRWRQYTPLFSDKNHVIYCSIKPKNIGHDRCYVLTIVSRAKQTQDIFHYFSCYVVYPIKKNVCSDKMKRLHVCNWCCSFHDIWPKYFSLPSLKIKYLIWFHVLGIISKTLYLLL